MPDPDATANVAAIAAAGLNVEKEHVNLTELVGDIDVLEGPSLAETALKLLGRRMTDKVTGFNGVVGSVWFDLTGCVQAILIPKVAADGKRVAAESFDVSRLEGSFDPADQVMPAPDYFTRTALENYDKGPSERPAGYLDRL